MVTDWMSKWALYSPNKIAVTEDQTNRTLTYAALHQLGEQTASYFANELKVQYGDRVAIVAENCLEYIVLFVAAQKLGFALVPMNYRLSSAEIDYLLKDAEPKLLISEPKFEATVQAVPQFSQLSNYLQINDLIPKAQQQAATTYPKTTLQEDDPIFILYTSGTTGFPKGAIYTHKMLFWNSVNTTITLIINTESRFINYMPPFHTGGWNVLTTPFLHHGGSIYIMKTFDAKAVLQLIEQQRPTLLFGVPTMLKMMAELPEFETTDMSSVLYAIVGGEPMPIPLIEKWHQREVFIRQGYGMTEVGPNISSLHQNDAIRRKGSIGRPNFYVQTKIIDAAGNECATNESGELLLKGPMVTPGYWKNEQATQKTIKDGWFHTGDIVIRDEEDYLFVVDRIKNMFISGGENVYPAEVERVIVSHPAVSEVVVIGIPDEKWGEVGKAFIVKNDPTLTVEALKAHCKSQLAKFKVPKHFEFLAEIPKSDTGKLNRKVLAKAASV